MTIPDITLYAILDPARSADRPLPELALQAIDGGVTLLQYRAKNIDEENRIVEARRIQRVIDGLGVPLIINDSPEIALAVNADGVHLGRDDADPQYARELLGAEAIIGLTVKTQDDARNVRLDLADYVFIGGVFDTTSKENPPSIGLEGWQQCAAIIREREPAIPIGAIAGIDATNVAKVIEAGADGVAVISAIFMANDIEAAARALACKIYSTRRLL
jgi:thiamine-phosphate pyrophosphorylase